MHCWKNRPHGVTPPPQVLCVLWDSMNLIFSEYLILTYLKATMRWQKLVEMAILVFNLPPASVG